MDVAAAPGSAATGAYLRAGDRHGLDDVGTNGMELIREIVDIYDNYEFATALRIAVGAACYPTHAVDAESLKRQAMSRPIVNWRGGRRRPDEQIPKTDQN